MNLFLSRLDEDQRRWCLALESQRMGWGADRTLFEITCGRGEQQLAGRAVQHGKIGDANQVTNNPAAVLPSATASRSSL